jgi:hypothetical protein
MESDALGALAASCARRAGFNATDGGGCEATIVDGSVTGVTPAPGVEAPVQGGMARVTGRAQSVAAPLSGSVAAERDSAELQNEAVEPAAGNEGEENLTVELLLSEAAVRAARPARTISTWPPPVEPMLADGNSCESAATATIVAAAAASLLLGTPATREAVGTFCGTLTE